MLGKKLKTKNAGKLGHLQQVLTVTEKAKFGKTAIFTPTVAEAKDFNSINNQ